MKLSFGIVFAAVVVLGCSAVSIPAGPVSDASLRKLKTSQETGNKKSIGIRTLESVPATPCEFKSQLICRDQPIWPVPPNFP